MALREPVVARREVTLEQLMALRRPVEIAVSPDGSKVACTVQESFARKGERLESSILLAETGDGAEVRLLAGGGGQNAVPRWSPSGKEVAFASDGDHPGRMSLRVLAVEAGEPPRPLGEIAGSVEDLRWAPDGRTLLVLAADLGADRAGAQTATKIVEEGAEEQDPQVTRPSLAWRRLLRVDAETGATVEVGPERTNVWEFDWRGGPAVAVCSDDPSESAWYDARLALLDLDARTASTLRVPEWQVQAPSVSPDGTRVAFVEGFGSDRGTLTGTVHVLDLASREARELAPELDVGMLEWQDDGTLRYAARGGLGSSCGTIDLDGRARELHGGAFRIGTRHRPLIASSADGATLASILDGPDQPPEVVVLEEDRARPVTSLNADVAAGMARPDWERFEWAADDGLEIEGLVALPPDRGSDPLPLVVLVHGGPTSCWTWEFAPHRGLPNMLAGAGYAALLPNPRGSAGRGQEFARANLGDMGGGDLRDILAGVDALVAAGVADDERVAIMGGSYGGFMSCWAITQTDRFAAAIPQAVVSDWTSFHLTTNIGRFDVLFLDSDPYDPEGEYPRRSPVFHARRCRTPTLIMHGAEDLCTPLGQAQELYSALVEAGCEAELVVYPREGHGWLECEHQIDAWKRTRTWLDGHLAPRG
jgi:dipeptidyl aminopeptidase/acylaminoacyl peptidase